MDVTIFVTLPPIYQNLLENVNSDSCTLHFVLSCLHWLSTLYVFTQTSSMFAHFLLQCVAAGALLGSLHTALVSWPLFTLTVPADLISNPGSVFSPGASLTATDVNPEKAPHIKKDGDSSTSWLLEHPNVSKRTGRARPADLSSYLLCQFLHGNKHYLDQQCI